MSGMTSARTRKDQPLDTKSITDGKGRLTFFELRWRRFILEELKILQQC